MIKLVVFDMDGLLIDSEPLWHEAEMEVFQEVGISLNKENCLETTGLRVDEVVNYWHQRYPWESPGKDRLAEKIVDRVIELIINKGELKPGVESALNFIDTLGVHVALASSSFYTIINAVMDKFGLRKYFQVIYSAQEEEFGKPHPGIYINVARKFNVLPDHSLAIEDSLTGVIAAKAAKMRCIAVPEEAWCNDPRFVLADLKLPSLASLDINIWHQLNRS